MHVRVGGESGACETFTLHLPGVLHPCADGAGGFSQAVVAQFFVIHARHFHVNVNAVHERAGDAALVLGDDARRAGAGTRGVAVITARAGVHRCHQLKVGGKGERALRAADGNDLILQRLAQHFERAAAELGEFVEEQHTAVRQRDLTRVRPVAASHQAGVADGVVRGAEWAAADQRYTGGQRVCHGVDAGYIK